MAEFDIKKTDNRLVIDSKYYNALDIEGFSRMMKDPSYCYKFYWLEAIVQMISENRCEATYNEIINEMIANAWYSVLEFHIHLSGIWGDGSIKDNLERAVLK
nr:HNH endonuclease [Lachnospiraceae bacterium]